jgi:hypothetical protein
MNFFLHKKTATRIAAIAAVPMAAYVYSAGIPVPRKPLSAFGCGALVGVALSWAVGEGMVRSGVAVGEAVGVCV